MSNNNYYLWFNLPSGSFKIKQTGSRIRWLAVCGFLSVVWWNIIVLIAGSMYEGYDHLYRFQSELGMTIAPTAWFYFAITGDPFHLSLKGDLNRDNEITPADVVIALKFSVSGGYDPIGDMNDDNQITSLDALMILQAAAGAISL